MPTYPIGEIARRTGLTVRALHHYDAEGLLVPSARTEAGHRRYTDADVARLQQIVSLRAVGLPLSSVRAVLDAGDALAVVEQHLAHVRARLAHETRLADRLAAFAALLRRNGTPGTDDLLTLIHHTTMFEKHYTPEQLQQLQHRAETLGPDEIQRVQTRWADLFARLDTFRLAGTAPDAPEAQALAAEARTLIAAFTGGDAGIRRSLDTAVAESKPAMHTAWGLTPEQGAYYDAVMKASSSC